MAETVRLPSIAIVWGSGDRLNPPMSPAPSLDGAAAEREPNTTNAPFSPPVRDATSGAAVGVGTSVEMAVGIGLTVAVTGAAVGISVAAVAVGTSAPDCAGNCSDLMR